MRRIVCKEENFNKGSGVDLYYTRHEFLIKCVFFKKKLLNGIMNSMNLSIKLIEISIVSINKKFTFTNKFSYTNSSWALVFFRITGLSYLKALVYIFFSFQTLSKQILKTPPKSLFFPLLNKKTFLLSDFKIVDGFTHFQCLP